MIVKLHNFSLLGNSKRVSIKIFLNENWVGASQVITESIILRRTLKVI